MLVFSFFHRIFERAEKLVGDFFGDACILVFLLSLFGFSVTLGHTAEYSLVYRVIGYCRFFLFFLFLLLDFRLDIILDVYVYFSAVKIEDGKLL